MQVVSRSSHSKYASSLFFWQERMEVDVIFAEACGCNYFSTQTQASPWSADIPALIPYIHVSSVFCRRVPVLCELISLSICATLNLFTVGCIRKKGKDKLVAKGVFVFPFVPHRRDAQHASAHGCSIKADHHKLEQAGS